MKTSLLSGRVASGAKDGDLLFSSRFVRWARLDRLDPRPGTSDRAIVLAFTARFTDELLSSAWLVLSPTFRRVFRLSLVQVGLCHQALNWVGLVIEPMTAAMIDLHSRRRLLCLGAAALAASMLAMASAHSFGWLLAAFAAFGLGSGPLVHTADVLVVESFPTAPERAYARATLVDTAGAFLGPGLVAVAALAGVSWRIVLVVLAGCAALYALGAKSTTFAPPPRPTLGRRSIVRDAMAGMGAAIGSREIRRTLIVLFCFDIFEAAFVLKYIWLHEEVGLSLPAVALWGAAEQGIDLVALVLLDRWLASRRPKALFRTAAGALTVLPAAWILAPGVAGRVLVGVPLALAHALIWPLAKSDSLTADADLAGATQALAALFPVIPLALLESGFAQAIGTGPAMAITAAVGAVAMCVASRAAQAGSQS